MKKSTFKIDIDWLPTYFWNYSHPLFSFHYSCLLDFIVKTLGIAVVKKTPKQTIKIINMAKTIIYTPAPNDVYTISK